MGMIDSFGSVVGAGAGNLVVQEVLPSILDPDTGEEIKWNRETNLPSDLKMEVKQKQCLKKIGSLALMKKRKEHAEGKPMRWVVGGAVGLIGIFVLIKVLEK